MDKEYLKIEDEILGKNIELAKFENLKDQDDVKCEFTSYKEEIYINEVPYVVEYYYCKDEEIMIIESDELEVYYEIQGYQNGDYALWLPLQNENFKLHPYRYFNKKIKDEVNDITYKLEDLTINNPWLEERIIGEYLVVFPEEEIKFVEGNIFNDIMKEISNAGKQCDTVAYKFLDDYNKKFELPQSQNSIIRKSINDILLTGSHITIFSLMKKLTIDLKSQLKNSAKPEVLKEGKKLIKNTKLVLEAVSNNEYIKSPYLTDNSALYTDDPNRTKVLIQEFNERVGTRTPKAGKFFKSFKLTSAELAQLELARAEYANRINSDESFANTRLTETYGGFNSNGRSLGRQNNLSGGPIGNENSASVSQEENVASVISDQNVLNRVGNGQYVSPKAPGEVLTIKEAYAKGWVNLDDFR